MRPMMKHGARLLAAAALTGALSTGAVAQDGSAQVYDVAASFEDTTFAVESAIVNRGLVIDLVSHVGAMLERTRAEVGGDPLFANADVFLFCSAVLSRKMMEADPLNIAFCPYGVFVTEAADGAVQVGYRHLPDGAMQEVEALLDAIAREAAGL